MPHPRPTPRHRCRAFLGAVGAALVASTGTALACTEPAPGAPPGEGGLIKVTAGLAPSTPAGHERQIDGCLVWLEFSGFAQDQQAGVTIVVADPGHQLVSHTATISDDDAGGPEDLDATLSYNLSTALASLPAPTSERGHLLEVVTDTAGASPATAYRAWMRCDPAPPTTLRIATAVEGSRPPSSGPFGVDLHCNHAPLDRTISLDGADSAEIADIPGGTVCVVSETDHAGAQLTKRAETPADSLEDGQVQLGAAGGAHQVRFTNIYPDPAPSSASAPAPAPAGPARPAAVAGAAAALLGGLVLRRRSALEPSRATAPTPGG